MRDTNFSLDQDITDDIAMHKMMLKKISEDINSLDKYAMIIKNNSGKKKQIYYKNPVINPANSIVKEHESFANSISNNSTPIISLEDGYLALSLASQIIKNI